MIIKMTSHTSLDTNAMTTTASDIARVATSSLTLDEKVKATASTSRLTSMTSSDFIDQDKVSIATTSAADLNGGIVITCSRMTPQLQQLTPSACGGGAPVKVNVMTSSSGGGAECKVVDADQFNVWRERLKRCKRLALQFIAFLCSTIGLCCLLCGYALLGGFVFRAIEEHNEVDIKEHVSEEKRRLVMRLWNYTMEVNVLHELNWTDKIDLELANYSKVIHSYIKKGWDGKFESEPTQWTYVGSLLYSVTVITTIGYGHIAPKTALGRAVTMFYAIFGIPLNFLTMANVGQFLAVGFRFLYRNVVRGLCCVYWREPDLDLVETYACPANGMPSKIPGGPEGGARRVRPKEEAWLCLNDNPSIMIDMDAAADGGRRRRKKKQQEEHYALRVYVTQGMRNLFDFKDIKKVNVPIYVSVLTVFAYILLGAALFSNWEGWGIGEGMYFCFVTLTTIGFGDVIPGTTLNARAETQSQEKLALCALYIFFGLALIAMCFDLVQQDIRSKFRRLGRWLGILESKATPDGKRGRRQARNRSKGSSSNGGRPRANGSNSHSVAEQKSRQSIVR